MHGGDAAAWREMVEESHARLLEELGARIESEIKRTVERAVELERERAKTELQREREGAEARVTFERESAKAQVEAERESAKAQIEAERESAKAQIEAERESAKAHIEAEREKTAAEVAKAMEKAQEATRRTTAESLNQALRRARRAATAQETLQVLAEASASHAQREASASHAPGEAAASSPPKASASQAQRSVVLVFENHQARVASSYGLASGMAVEGADAPFGLDLNSAPALVTAIENKEPLAALAREGEVPPALMRLLGAEAGEKLYLFPVTVRHQVVALLVAAGGVSAPAAELLAEAAGMRLESLSATPRETAAPDLVQIQRPAVPAAAASERRGWEDLSPEDQQMHLQAQRVARVRVAEMRLNREDAWRRGLAELNVYGALRREIENARTEFLQTFLSKSPTMVDYLHLEILRSLANEDDRVLGSEYPGPMV